jgi:hypothetical protein
MLPQALSPSIDDGGLGLPSAILLCALGVLISILIPVVRKAAGIGAGAEVAGESPFATLWELIRPYALYAFLSLLVSIVLIAFSIAGGQRAFQWWEAFLLGYAWDSTLQKVTGKP